MKLSFAIFAAAAITSANAFVPAASSPSTASLRMSNEVDPVDSLTQEISDSAPSVTSSGLGSLDSSLPCYGLPGAIAPLGYFDPMGFCEGKGMNEVKRIREAELMHCRVAMMAVIGYFIQENTPTIAFGFDHPIVANDQIPEVPTFVMFPFFMLINLAEAFRASKGWEYPNPGTLFTLRDNYAPGDLGFDPFGLKPADNSAFVSLQNKELSNGRLAMIAVAGFCAQEQVNKIGILQNLGIDPLV